MTEETRAPAGRAPAAGEGGGWLRHLDRRGWALLGVTMLFWMFDGYETFAVIITGPTSLRELLAPDQLPATSRFFGYLLAITLLGWTVGGVLGGFVGDRLGRRKTMITAVVLYGIFTALSALSWNWEILAVTRFLTGIGIGAEWAVGTSLLQEVLPGRARTRSAGLLQATFSVGGLIVSGLWIIFNSWSDVSWRYIYVVGVIPAFLVVLLRKVIPESKQWINRRKSSVRALMAELNDAELRSRLIKALLVSIAVTVGFWAASSYLPTYVGSLAPEGRTQFYTGWAGAVYNIGEIIGCIVFGFWAERWGRRPTMVIYSAGSLIIVPVVFELVGDAGVAVILQIVAGYLTGGIYSWFTVHTPELFPTAVRSSAIGLIFNLSRILAAAGALVAGTLAGALGGVGNAASVFAAAYILGIVFVLMLPETKGKPLPL
jgi:MFS family permease